MNAAEAAPNPFVAKRDGQREAQLQRPLSFLKDSTRHTPPRTACGFGPHMRHLDGLTPGVRPSYFRPR
jgi:hypothetical protein